MKFTLFSEPAAAVADLPWTSSPLPCSKRKSQMNPKCSRFSTSALTVTSGRIAKRSAS